MDLYIVSSPFQLFLAIGISEEGSKDICILIDEGNILSDYRQVAERHFGDVFYLDFPFGRLSKYLQFNWLAISFAGRVKKLLKALEAKGRINTVYLGNDHFFGNQIIAACVPCRERVFIEDGSALYNNWTFQSSRLRRLFYWLLFGNKAKQIEHMGTAFDYAKRLLLFPELVRPELKSQVNESYEAKHPSKIIAEMFSGLPDVKLLEESISKENVAVFLLSRLDTYAESNWFEKRLDIFDTGSRRILVKEHPMSLRTKNNRIDHLTKIPSLISAELLPGLLNMDMLIGPPTSALYSIRFFFPDIRVVCVVENETAAGTRFVKMLAQTGIDLEIL